MYPANRDALRRAPRKRDLMLLDHAGRRLVGVFVSLANLAQRSVPLAWQCDLGQHLVPYHAAAARGIVLRVALIANEVFAAAKRSRLAARLGFELRGFLALVLAAPSLPPSSQRLQPRHAMRIRPTCEGHNAELPRLRACGRTVRDGA
jgi:hypothetical protein